LLTPPAVPAGAWTPKLLYSFANNVYGDYPIAPALFDPVSRVIYVEANEGSYETGIYDIGPGAIIKLTFDGAEWLPSRLHSFIGGVDGAFPQGALIMDKAGALYGVTPYGGNNQLCKSFYDAGCGVVFKITQ
jgi:hypothetical protein